MNASHKAFADFKARVTAMLAEALPFAASKHLTTGDHKNIIAQARVIIDREAVLAGYNPAALSTRWDYAKTIEVV